MLAPAGWRSVCCFHDIYCAGHTMGRPGKRDVSGRGSRALGRGGGGRADSALRAQAVMDSASWLHGCQRRFCFRIGGNMALGETCSHSRSPLRPPRACPALTAPSEPASKASVTTYFLSSVTNVLLAWTLQEGRCVLRGCSVGTVRPY